jgi:hypothetical protein
MSTPASVENQTNRLVELAPTPSHLTDQEIATWRKDLDARLQRVLANPEQNMGFMEEHLEQATLEPKRRALQRAMQTKADATACPCVACQRDLTDRRRIARTIQSRFGPATFTRQYGWCPRCEQWCFPADYALGLGQKATASPFVQETAALLVSKMPAEQAEPVAERLIGIKISRATLDREARRQGQKAQALRAAQAQQFDAWEGIQKEASRLQQAPPRQPFTLVIEIDAWNIRERDFWGQTQAKRNHGQDLSRWHWVYVATCFRLDHRAQTAGGRPVITERGFVATRLGVEELIRQLYRQAVGRGLWLAERVLVIADGAVWIWNAVQNRFPQARQRLDLFHADEHLWAIANDLHGKGTPQARAFVTPLLKQIRDDQTVEVIQSLEELKARLAQPQQLTLEKQIQYLQNNQHRMHYKEVFDAQKATKSKRRKPTRKQNSTAAEPVGSGAIESTCRQYQCRFKRSGQFWTQTGDEALLCVETFWRNDRWTQLYPHAALTSSNRN